MNGENYKYFKDIYDKMLVMQKEIYKLVEILRKNEKITDAQFSDVLDISANMISDNDTRDEVKKTCDKIIEEYKSIQGDQTLKEFFEKHRRRNGKNESIVCYWCVAFGFGFCVSLLVRKSLGRLKNGF